MRGYPVLLGGLLLLAVFASGRSVVPVLRPVRGVDGSPAQAAPAQQADMPPLPYEQTGGLMACAHSQGQLIWLCEGPRLVALDIADPRQPRVLGRSEPLGVVLRGLVVEEDGRHAWVLADPHLIRLDLGDPWHPRVLGRSVLDWSGISAEVPYRSAIDLALAGGRVWLPYPGHPTWLVSQPITDPAASARPLVQDLVSYAAGQVLSLAGRGDRLYVLALRRGQREWASGPQDLLTFLVPVEGAPRLLQVLPVPTAGDVSWRGERMLRWDGDTLWSVNGNQTAAWGTDEHGLTLLSHGRTDCLEPVGSQVRAQRLYLTCSDWHGINNPPMVVDLSRPPGFPTLAWGQDGQDDPGRYSRATALTDGSFWFSNDAGEWQGLDLGPEGSVPGLSRLGQYAGIGAVSFLAWDAPRERLLVSGSSSARAIQVGAAGVPQAGPILAAGFLAGAMVPEGDRLFVHFLGDADVRVDQLLVVDLAGLPGVPPKVLVGWQTPFDRPIRRYSVLADTLLTLTGASGEGDLPSLEQRTLLADGGPTFVRSWPLPDEPLAVHQSQVWAAVLSQETLADGRPRWQMMIADKRDGRRIDLPFGPPGLFLHGADLVLREDRLWAATSTLQPTGDFLYQVWSLDLGADPPASLTERWHWSRGRVEHLPPAPHQVGRLQVSPDGDTLALLSTLGELHLLKVQEDGALRPLAELALPAFGADLAFDADGDTLYIAARSGGLLELHRPAGGWSILPGPEPRPTVILPLPTPAPLLPTRTATSPGAPAQAWLPRVGR